MNYAEDTKTQVNQDGYTDSTNASPYLNDMNLNKSTAHKLLDKVREGSTTPSHLIQAALHATGDL